MTVVVDDPGPALTGRPRFLVETAAELSWVGILAGAVVGIAVAAALTLAGAGLGLMLADIGGSAHPSSKTLGVASLVWLALVQVAGMFAGGYVAGRTLTPDVVAPEETRRERYALQGLAVWATGTVLSMLVATTLVTGAVSLAVRGVVGLGAAATAGAGAAAGKMDVGELGFELRQLLAPMTAPPVAATSSGTGAATTNSPPPVAGGASPPGTGGAGTLAGGMDQTGNGMVTPSGAEGRDDASAILQRGWTDKGFDAADRGYLQRILVQRYGLSPKDAEVRVAESEARLKDAQAKAEDAVRKAREAAIKASRVLALVGFIIAVLGALAAVGGGIAAESHRRIAIA